MASPYVIDYANYFNIPSMIFLGFVSLVQTILCYFLKETLNKKAEEQIHELKSKSNSFATEIKI